VGINYVLMTKLGEVSFYTLHLPCFYNDLSLSIGTCRGPFFGPLDFLIFLNEYAQFRGLELLNCDNYDLQRHEPRIVTYTPLIVGGT
jgi:hypothetical protein